MKTATRLLAGIMIAAGGLIHWELWRDGYQGIAYVGTLFAVNVGVSVVVAIALVASGDRRVVGAAMLLSVASLGALVLSRTTGLLGFMEATWTPAAVQAVAAEVGALAALGVFWARARGAALVPARVG